MMPVSLHLAIRQWRARPLRPILCSLAIAAAVALVVCVGAGFDSARATMSKMIGQMLGTADIHVRSTAHPPSNRLPVAVLDGLRARSQVAMASGRLQAQLAIAVQAAVGEGAGKSEPQAEPEIKWFNAVGIDPRYDDRLRPKAYITGSALSGADEQIVIDEVVAKRVNAKLGDVIRVGNGQTLHPAHVVGIVAGPTIELVQHPTVYVTDKSLARDLALPLEYNVIDLELKPGVQVQDYAKTLQADLGATMKVATSTDGQSKMEHETKPMDLALLILSVVSGLCAALIIGTTLSVGVQERIRQFGQLRCIGAARGQLVQMLMADALLLMLAGTALGVVAGIGLSKALVWKFPNIFLVYKVTSWSLLAAVGNGLIATLFGSLIPAWQVWRVSPMQAIQTVGHAVRPRLVWLAGGLGACAIVLQILLWQISDRDVRFWCYVCAGIPLIFTGYALLGPMALVALEKFGYRAISAIFGLRAPLLRQAWSRTPWRSGGMIAALMIGITLFTAVRERGQGLMASWAFPSQFPDIMMYSFLGSTQEGVQNMAQQIPEIQLISPVCVFAVPLKKAMFRIGPVLPDEQTLFVACDPDVFSKLIKMEFVQGDEPTALAQLKAGHAVFVSREYQAARGIGVGDTITLGQPNGEPVDFTVAAVVASPGMDIAKHYFDLDSAYKDKAVSSVMGTTGDAKKYFGQTIMNLALANAKPGTDIPKLRSKIERYNYWQTASSVEMKTKITEVVTRFVDAMSLLALAAMFVASLGVANMVIASVHARRYEFGILRAVGAGRWQLMRLVLAEASLIALTAGILGSITGLHIAFMATRVDRTLTGYQTAYLMWWQIPWPILCGIAVTLPLGWLASIFPAWRGASTAQQVLLASGRG